MTATTAAKTDKLGFPVITCSRCGGTGVLEHFGHVDGGRCFKCIGTGVVRVGKAKKAYDAYKAAVDAAYAATVSDLQAGDTFTTGDARCVTRWCILQSVSPDSLNPGRVILRTNKGGIGTDPSNPVRIYRKDAVDITPFLAAAK